MASTGLACSLVVSGGLKVPTGTATLRGKVTALAGALIPATQVSVQQPVAKAARASLKPRQGFSSLPVAAQAVVSATLGRDDARYQVRPKAGAQSRRADVPRASCPCSGMAKMAMAQSVGALSAQNPAQALQADFTSQGMEVRSGQTHWRLELGAYGYGDHLEKVEGAAPQRCGNRVEYQRGPLVEWYVNGPAGIEQGFTLSAPPALGTRDTGHGTTSTGYGARDTGYETPNSAPLTIALEIGGDLTASTDSPAEGRGDARAEGLTLRDGYGQAVLRYTGLTAHDASGRALAAWLEVGKEELRLRVEDAGARYPVIVDPFVQQAVLTASDGASDDLLGFSVAYSSDGSTIVAGAPQAAIDSNTTQGAAYVFVMPEGGWATTSTFTAKLTASDGASGDGLGYSVGISSDGGTVVAGAPYNNVEQGAAYVFVKLAGGWTSMTQTAKLTTLDADYYLGFSVGVSGDGSTIGVGGPYAGYPAVPGAAYVFVMPEGGWATTSTFTAKLTASDAGRGDELGYSFVGVSGDGSTIVAGALYATVNSNHDQGAAYVFVKPGAGWTSATETAKLTASDGVADDFFAYSGAISSGGSAIVVGEPDATIGSNTLQGAAYVFVKPGGGWVSSYETAKLTASDGNPSNELGFSVGVSSDGSTIVAGAPYSSPDEGAMYVFARPVGGWANTSTFTAKLTPSDGGISDFLGNSVGVSGDGMAIAAGAYGFNGDTGAAYVFLTAPTVTFTGAPASEPYQGTFNVASTTNSSTSPVYTSNDSCSHVGPQYTMTSGSGSCYAIATWAGDVNYASAKVIQRTTASKIAPTVTFTGAPASEADHGMFTVASTTTSSSSPVYTANGSCTNVGTQYTMTKATGTCSAKVSWVTDSDYLRASLTQTTTATKIAPTVTFTGAPATEAYQGTFTVASTTDSSSSPEYTASGSCTNVGTLYTMTKGTGACTSTVSWVTDANYLRASLTQTTTAAKGVQTISFTTPAPATAADHSTFTVAADSSSGLTVGFSVDAGSTGVCKLGTRTVTGGVSSAPVTMLKSAGTCTIDANQAGNGNYNAAAQVFTSAAATP